ncbi:MAG: FAD-binding protein [Candidatus Heimdallarchaeum aukensis]|uniref:FAD-binding protein n=1 Tax=Candidatus Heimdallarchaeum aukensis TaxID=2876573 RepID=A0A9Y1FKQ5_9ARCH|nr:MAG: FAD-binding protein [Candidatus Heimdallarchaeum aukensis]
MIRGYPESMRKSIDKVNKTRDKRIDQIMKDLTLEEREKVLKEFHPDYNPAYKRTISWGQNKGDYVPNEVADILESYPIYDPDEIDLSQIDYDVGILIIGAGGAGTAAALWSVYSGVPNDKILLTTKLRLGDCNTVMAQGGIQAADRPEDSPLIHYLDAMGGGHFKNKPELVKALVSDGPKIIKWHKELGLMYDQNEDGSFVENAGGGTSRNRMHCAKDYTGMEIFRNLKDEVINNEIPLLEFSPAVELLKDENGRVAGALLYNLETKEYSVVRAKTTILTTGGFGRLHIAGFATTNHYGATGDGIVMAYRAGAKLRDLDSTQFHPTGAAFPEQIVGLLITEKVRSLGAQVLGKNGEQICYPLEPRDVEAASIIRVTKSTDNYVETPTGMRGVWLDSPLIEEIRGKGTIDKNLAAMKRMFARFDIDMTEDPILVHPTLHYQNGGVELDENGYTSVPGLLGAGEISGGVHGKNRLMGNSLLEVNVFGRRAGITAAKEYKRGKKPGKLTLSHVKKTIEQLDALNIKKKRFSPIILPEYRSEAVRDRLIQLFESSL